MLFGCQKQRFARVTEEKVPKMIRVVAMNDCHPDGSKGSKF